MVGPRNVQPTGQTMINRRELLKVTASVAGVSTIAGNVGAQTQQNKKIGINNGNKITKTFAYLDSSVHGVLWDPVPQSSRSRGDKARTAVLLMHGDSDFLDHPAAPELAKRGYRVMTANTHASQSLPSLGVPGEGYSMSEVIPDVGRAVRYLYDLEGVENVVLAGHSGGCPLFSLYQNVAENGPNVCNERSQLGPCPDFEDQPPADGFVILDGHLGYGVMGLNSLDPAIVDEDDPRNRDSSVDMFDPANGYSPNGANYSEEFIDDFVEQQAQRKEKLNQFALDRLQAIENDNGDYKDDEVINVPSMEARPWLTDTSLLSRTKNAWKLLKNDGTTSNQIVESVRPSLSPDTSGNLSYLTFDGDLQTSIRKYLLTHAIRPTDSYDITETGLEGIDWSSSYTATPRNIQGISVPLLQVAMTGFWFVTQNETIHENASSSDKELVYVEGASHGFTPISDEYSGTFKRTFDYVDDWLNQRFK